jgi:hypothetical protein|nr:MAG TPA: hypothetical protein [Caudoviricetes sp.]
MNKATVQEIYNRVNEPRNISAVEALGLKSCLYCDLFGTFSVENISDTDVYIQVKSKLQDLCWYALNAKPEPVAKDCNGDPIYIGGTVWYDDEEYLVRAYKPASDNNNERILATCCDAWESPMWLYLGGNDVTVRNPNAQDDALAGAREAMKALQKDLQENVFPSLEKVLESLREAQKD